MHRFRRRSRLVFVGLTFSALLASCADGGEDEDNRESQSGAGGLGAKGGTTSLSGKSGSGPLGGQAGGGAGGRAGSGSGMGARGGSGGSAGLNVGGSAGDPGPSSAGDPGEGGDSGEGTAGGGSDGGGAGDGSAGEGTAGEGGDGAGGGSAGSAGSEGCAEIELGELVAVHTFAGRVTSAAFLSQASPIGTAAPDILTTSFYTGGGYEGHLIGSFTLGTGDEANYETCQRCVLFARDADTANERLFFASAGQITIAAGSAQTIGYGTFSLTDVTLREITFDAQFVSSFVPDGLCVQLASGNVTFTEADWNCEPGFFGAGDGCDCGCGGSDPDCENASIESCANCHCPGDAADCIAENSVNPVDNAQCLPSAPGGGD
jgi:hypothetical protein